MDLINSYAVVAYVAGPVARFADKLRRELSPGCPHRAHITLLTPRPLGCSTSEAIEFARHQVAPFEPFDVRFGSIEQFQQTQVIYLSLASGARELRAIHDVLNSGLIQQPDLYTYTPHITLGQLLAPESFETSLELARRRWEEFGPPPGLHVETLTFVQQNADGCWRDIEELALGHPVTALG